MTTSTIMAPVPEDHPLMKDWTEHKASAEYANSTKWASDPEHLEGSLWALFMAGWDAATERAAMLHESVDSASDDERENGHPGAGAMSAVIDYRDLIRQQAQR